MKDRLELLVFVHQKHEHPGNIQKIAEEEGVNLNIYPLWSPTFHQVDSFPITNMDGLLIMGGSMGVNGRPEDYPTKTAELRSIQNAYGKIPVVGICLGSQAIAKALGAEVYQGRVKEVGFDNLSITDEGSKEPLFKGLTPPLLAVHWHGEVFDLPAGAKRLVSSEDCENQAFSVREGRRLLAYGQLFHLEITKEMIPDWIKASIPWIHEGIQTDEQRLLRLSAEKEQVLEAENRTLWRNLFAEMREQARARGKFL